jgi:alpha-L-fucosidase
LTKYGDISVLWFDGGWEHSAAENRAQEILDLARKLQPGIVINDRSGLPADYATPEQYIPRTPLNRDWETCMTINWNWGYNKGDSSWKSSAELVRNLARVAGGGGNYLLNVGPTAEGLIPGPSVDRLAEVGKWMRSNGESIYGTSAGPFRKLPWNGACTSKDLGNGAFRLYLHVFEWANNILLPGLKNQVLRVSIPSDPGRRGLSSSRTGEDVVINLAGAAPDPADSIVIVDVKGPPEADPVPAVPDKDGNIMLKAVETVIHGQTARYEEGKERDCIGYWMETADWIDWRFKVGQPGSYGVTVSYSCDDGTTDAVYVVETGGIGLTNTVAGTGSWGSFREADMGTIRLGSGTRQLAVRILKKPGFAAMNLRSVNLRRVK